MNLNAVTYAINGAIFAVHSTLGAGFLEKVYENALMIELKNRSLDAENQVPLTVQYQGQPVGEYFADIVVNNQVILEIKAVIRIDKIHEAQLLNYLKASGFQVGLLVNFNAVKADIRRFVMTPDNSI
ncbi:MAG: GxxExxY protein [Pseudomonadota bacterium]